jgi:hypothetical protein
MSGTTAFAQDAGIPDEDVGINNLFGHSVAAHGDWAVVGAPTEGDGAAHIYQRSPAGPAGRWRLRQSIRGAGPEFGSSVDIQGGTIVVGSPGANALMVYQRTPADEFVLSDELSGEEGFTFGLGVDVDLDGSFVAISADGRDRASSTATSAQVIVFRRAELSWQLASVVNPASGSLGQKYPVALQGNKELLVGVPHANSVQHYVVEGDGRWYWKKTISAPISCVACKFGTAVDIEGNAVLVGAPAAESGKGHAYLLTRSGTEDFRVFASLPQRGREFGADVALVTSGQWLWAIVGAPLTQVGSNVAQGQAFMFAGSAELLNWFPQGVLDQGSNGRAGDSFGHSVSFGSERLALVGAPLDDSDFIDQGTATFFRYGSTGWSYESRVSALTAR